MSTVGRQPAKPRIVGEHFRSDGSPKRRFPTQAAAERHAQRYHLNQDLYECSFCGGFHFATKRVWEKP